MQILRAAARKWASPMVEWIMLFSVFFHWLNSLFTPEIIIGTSANQNDPSRVQLRDANCGRWTLWLIEKSRDLKIYQILVPKVVTVAKEVLVVGILYSGGYDARVRLYIKLTSRASSQWPPKIKLSAYHILVAVFISIPCCGRGFSARSIHPTAAVRSWTSTRWLHKEEKIHWRYTKAKNQDLKSNTSRFYYNIKSLARIPFLGCKFALKTPARIEICCRRRKGWKIPLLEERSPYMQAVASLNRSKRFNVFAYVDVVFSYMLVGKERRTFAECNSLTCLLLLFRCLSFLTQLRWILFLSLQCHLGSLSLSRQHAAN